MQTPDRQWSMASSVRPASCHAFSIAYTPNVAARLSQGFRCSMSSSATFSMSISLPMRTGNASLSNCWMWRTPERPCRTESHSVDVSPPSEVITPIPVMTTRLPRLWGLIPTSSDFNWLLSIAVGADAAEQVGGLRHRGRLGLAQGEGELRRRDPLVLAVRLALHRGLGRVLTGDLDLQPELVAGHHEVAEAQPVVRADDAHAPEVAGLAHHPVGELGHRLGDHHARHDRLLREVVGQEVLAERHVLDAGRPPAALELDDAVHEQESHCLTSPSTTTSRSSRSTSSPLRSGRTSPHAGHSNSGSESDSLVIVPHFGHSRGNSPLARSSRHTSRVNVLIVIRLTTSSARSPGLMRAASASGMPRRSRSRPRSVILPRSTSISSWMCWLARWIRSVCGNGTRNSRSRANEMSSMSSDWAL